MSPIRKKIQISVTLKTLTKHWRIHPHTPSQDSKVRTRLVSYNLMICLIIFFCNGNCCMSWHTKFCERIICTDTTQSLTMCICKSRKLLNCCAEASTSVSREGSFEYSWLVFLCIGLVVILGLAYYFHNTVLRLSDLESNVLSGPAV